MHRLINFDQVDHFDLHVLGIDCLFSLLVGKTTWRVCSIQGQLEMWFSGVCHNSQARGLSRDDGIRATDTGQC